VCVCVCVCVLHKEGRVQKREPLPCGGTVQQRAVVGWFLLPLKTEVQHFLTRLFFFTHTHACVRRFIHWSPRRQTRRKCPFCFPLTVLVFCFWDIPPLPPILLRYRNSVVSTRRTFLFWFLYNISSLTFQCQLLCTSRREQQQVLFKVQKLKVTHAAAISQRRRLAPRFESKAESEWISLNYGSRTI